MSRFSTYGARILLNNFTQRQHRDISTLGLHIVVLENTYNIQDLFSRIEPPHLCGIKCICRLLVAGDWKRTVRASSMLNPSLDANARDDVRDT